MKKPSILHLLLLLLILPSSFAVDFLFNGFHNDSDLYILPGAALQSNILVLTKAAGSVPGRALYKHEIPTKSSNYPSPPLPFSTSFVFSALPTHSPAFFLSFILAPTPATTEHIPSVGFNKTDGALQQQTQILSVEFGVSRSDWRDPYYACVNVNSRSVGGIRNAGYTDPFSGSFRGLALNNGENYQAWIEYGDSLLNVTVAPAGVGKPNKPLLSVDMDASQLVTNETYAGFFVDTEIGDRVGVLAWSFSNSNFSMHEALTASNLPSFSEAHTSSSRRGGFIAGISAAAAVLFGIGVAALALFIRRKAKRKIGSDAEEMEEWQLEYWPHQIRFEDIFEATDGFSDSNVIGEGSNGKVYKGVLRGQMEVAVKCIRQEKGDGMREFLAEISTLGRLRHRNLVGLRGWCKCNCKRGRGNLILVYDFMKNGSLDRRIFDCDGEDGLMLGWGPRVRVLRDIAAGVLYLHEGWEKKVVHRDIKASNVMLDGEMRGRLGDFGLARVHSHAARAAPVSTGVVGTVGYMAPEVVRGGKVSEKADVFGFGVLVLEVVCGRRPVEDGSKPLVEWVRGLMEGGELAGAMDGRLEKGGGYEDGEAERLLHLGLLCTSGDPPARPSMREVVYMLDGEEGAASKARWILSGNSKDQFTATCIQPHELTQSSFGGSYESDTVVEGR